MFSFPEVQGFQMLFQEVLDGVGMVLFNVVNKLRVLQEERSAWDFEFLFTFLFCFLGDSLFRA